MKVCECGCGQEVRVRFLPGHNSQFIKRKRKSPVDYVSEDRGYKTPCWTWQQGKTGQGYGLVSVNKRHELAHRNLYEQVKGSIPVGMELDHLCRNRDCVNPDHMEPVTHAVNIRRGPQSKLSMESARIIRQRCADGDRKDAVARDFGVDPSIIYDVVNERIWREGA